MQQRLITFNNQHQQSPLIRRHLESNRQQWFLSVSKNEIPTHPTRIWTSLYQHPKRYVHKIQYISLEHPDVSRNNVVHHQINDEMSLFLYFLQLNLKTNGRHLLHQRMRMNLNPNYPIPLVYRQPIQSIQVNLSNMILKSNCHRQALISKHQLKCRLQLIIMWIITQQQTIKRWTSSNDSSGATRRKINSIDFL